MEKETTYWSTVFSADVVSEALEVFRAQVDTEEKPEFSYRLAVDIGNDSWRHDSVEEFFADYRRGSGYALFAVDTRGWPSQEMRVTVHGKDIGRFTTVAVKASSRSQIETIFGVFERHSSDSKLPIESSKARPIIFIGHGHSPVWRDLKDHLQDLHHYDVVAYEVGARAGHGIRDILEDMLRESTFAILVMTGEDETIDDNVHPRLNVVHEAGLFQGSLGFSRAIVLLEEGTQEFSNIHGIDQIRFSIGNIRETFGDVVATIHREFPVGTAQH